MLSSSAESHARGFVVSSRSADSIGPRFDCPFPSPFLTSMRIPVIQRMSQTSQSLPHPFLNPVRGSSLNTHPIILKAYLNVILSNFLHLAPPRHIPFTTSPTHGGRSTRFEFGLGHAQSSVPLCGCVLAQSCNNSPLIPMRWRSANPPYQSNSPSLTLVNAACC
jgi:hypothetical protein